MRRNPLAIPWLQLAALAALIGFTTAEAAAGPVVGPAKDYVVIGSSRIYKGNTANARQAAIDNGLDVAVAEAVVELMPADHLVGHLSVVSKTIGGRSDDFLQGYKVLSEAAAGKDYRVVLSATVSLDTLRREFNAAGVTMSRKAMPRTLLFVVEKDALNQFPEYWWGGDRVLTVNASQKVLEGKLQEAGFMLINPSRPPEGEAQLLDYPPNIDVETLMHLAMAYGAEVIVVGTAQAGLAANTMGDQMRSYRAVMGVKALRVEDKKIIASAEQEAIVTASDDAQGLRKAQDAAAVKTGETLAAQLAAAWLVSEDLVTEVKITIEGTRDLANFVLFRRVMKKMPGVKSIQTTEMKPDQATLVVVYQGDVASLADGIMRTDFEPFSIDIYDVTDQTLRAALIPR